MQSKLRRDGHRFLLNDDQLADLKRLQAPRITPCDDGGVRIAQESLLHDGVAHMPALPLGPLILHELREKGHDVQQVSDCPISTLPCPAAGSEISYPSLARFVQANVTGLIDARADFDVDVAAIASLARAYPMKRIMVVGDRRKSLSRILRVLRGFGLPARGAFSRSSRRSLAEDAPRLLVSTFMAAADFDLAHCDIVIFADAEECAHERATMMLSQVDARFRLFGLMRKKRFHEQARSTRADLRRVFGFESISLRSYNRVRVDSQVTWIKNRQNFIDLSNEDVNYHRDVIWNNRRRNREIKAVINEVRNDVSQHSVILVKNLQHASALARGLPDWQVWIADREVREVQRMNNPFRAKAKLIGTDWLRGPSIVTTACAARYPGYSARNIIWAGSGVEPEIPSSWFYRKDDGIERPVQITDFADRFNREASRLARRRQDWYRVNSVQGSFAGESR